MKNNLKLNCKVFLRQNATKFLGYVSKGNMKSDPIPLLNFTIPRNLTLCSTRVWGVWTLGTLIPFSLKKYIINNDFQITLAASKIGAFKDLKSYNEEAAVTTIDPSALPIVETDTSDNSKTASLRPSVRQRNILFKNSHTV